MTMTFSHSGHMIGQSFLAPDIQNFLKGYQDIQEGFDKGLAKNLCVFFLKMAFLWMSRGIMYMYIL